MRTNMMKYKYYNKSVLSDKDNDYYIPAYEGIYREDLDCSNCIRKDSECDGCTQKRNLFNYEGWDKVDE